MTWHADSTLVERYTRGDIDDAAAFSLESHLLACEECRVRVGASVDQSRLAGTWAEIEATVDAPRPSPVERLLLRLGIRSHLARLLAATPALRLSWLAAVALALAFAAGAAYGTKGERAMLLFLLIAPLLPLAGVAAAFAPGLDPAYEMALASPFGGFRLLLVRSAAVLATTIALGGLSALALPGFHAIDAAWLLPALALSVASLALATFLPPLRASALVGGLWVMGVALSEVVASGSVRAALSEGPIESALFQPAGQMAFLVLTLLSAFVVAGRRHTFDLGRAA